MWFILSTAKTLADSDSLAFCQVTHVCGLLSECGLGISAWVFTMLDDRTVVCEQGMVLSSPCSAVPGCKLSQVKWGSSFHVSHASHVSRPCVAAPMDLPSDLPDLPSDLPVLASCQAGETAPSISGKRPRKSTSGATAALQRKSEHSPELPAGLPDLPDTNRERAEANAMPSDCNSIKPAVPKSLPAVLVPCVWKSRKRQRRCLPDVADTDELPQALPTTDALLGTEESLPTMDALPGTEETPDQHLIGALGQELLNKVPVDQFVLPPGRSFAELKHLRGPGPIQWLQEACG